MSETLTLYVDLDRCWGCGTCEVACAVGTKSGPGMGRVRIEEARGNAGAAIPGSPQGRAFVPILCQQCASPACAKVCPSGALARDESGIVALDAEKCTACGACAEACPFGAIALSPENGKPLKCDQCEDRRRAGLLPFCVQHCPGKAISLQPVLAETEGAPGGEPAQPDGREGPGAPRTPPAAKGRGPKRLWSAGGVRYIARG